MDDWLDGYYENKAILEGTLNVTGDTVMSSSITAFDSTGFSDGSAIFFSGRDAANDGGGGWFTFSSSSVATTDGGIVFAPTGGGRLFRHGYLFTGGFNGDVKLKFFGEDGEDAVRLALAYAGSIGGCKLTFSGVWTAAVNYDPLFTIPANTEIVGDGESSILNINTGTDTSGNIFTMSGDGGALRNMVVNFNCVATSPDTQVAFNIAASKLEFDRLIMTGSHTDVVTSILHCFVLNQNATYEDLDITGCTIQNFRYGMLRSNTSTGTHKKIRIVNNIWKNNYANHIALNTPNGVLDDVSVFMNRFLDCPGGDAFGTFAIMLGMASCTNYRVMNNHFEGICKEALHLEEAGGNIIVTGNTLKNLDKGTNTNGGRGAYITNNNIGGVAAGLERFIMTGNTITGSGSATADYGIRIVDGLSSSVRSVDKYMVTANTISGFNIGIGSDDLSDDAIVTDNTIFDCTTGLALTDTSVTIGAGAIIADNKLIDCVTGIDCNRGWPDIRDNVIKNATTGILSDRPGMFGSNTFKNVTTQMSSSGEKAELEGWTVEKTALTIAATPTNTVVDLFAFPDVCAGELSILLFDANNSAIRVVRYYDLDITSGGVVTATLRGQRTVGAVSVTGNPANNAGQLSVTFTNSGAEQTEIVVQARFTGMYAL